MLAQHGLLSVAAFAISPCPRRCVASYSPYRVSMINVVMPALPFTVIENFLWTFYLRPNFGLL